MAGNFDIVIVGAGILGTSISYFLAHLNPSKNIAVIEQAPRAAYHTSGRNTGKVHAPYLYDPRKKGLLASAAFHGFEMWETYAKLRGLPFKRDGVIEVSLGGDGAKTLERHLKWGIENGLGEDEISIMDGTEVKKIEPNVRCESAIYCTRDGAADFGAYTEALMRDSAGAGTRFVPNTRVDKVSRRGSKWEMTLDTGNTVAADFLINAAGGNAIDIAHDAGVATGLTDVHFRGEYWKVPAEYWGLAGTSIYSVPDFAEYPFLDPHWIVRVDGSREIGPNAVPVFSPYGYGAGENARTFIPKVLEMLGSGARKAIFDGRFQELAAREIRSSMSKSSMVGRVGRFLPGMDAARITEKGTAGIRSSVVDGDGKFVPDAVLEGGEASFHILNYNSPGATGALPFAAHIVDRLDGQGLLQNERDDAQCGPWKFGRIIEKIP